jgi:hypothetical protein
VGGGLSSNADHGQWHGPEGKAHLRSDALHTRWACQA